MPYFSIIMPCFNVEQYISYSIESIIKQSFSDWELIIVDDGSTDRTMQILDDYSHIDARINVIHKKNEGVSIARNKGLDVAKGDWVLFLDSDDWFEYHTLKKIKYLINDSNAEIIGFNCFYNSETKEWRHERIKPYKIERSEITIKYLKLDTLFPYYDKKENGVSVGVIRGVWSKAIKRELIEKHHIRFDSKVMIGEDALFCFDIFSVANKIVLYDEYLIHYRIYQNSTMNKYNSNILKINNDSLCSFYYRINKDIKKGDKDYKICFCGIAAECLFRTFRMYLLHTKCPLSFKRKKEIIKEMLQSEMYKIAFDCNLSYLPLGKKEMVFCAKYGFINLLLLISYFSCIIIKWKKK